MRTVQARLRLREDMALGDSGRQARRLRPRNSARRGEGLFAVCHQRTPSLIGRPQVMAVDDIYDPTLVPAPVGPCAVGTAGMFGAARFRCSWLSISFSQYKSRLLAGACRTSIFFRDHVFFTALFHLCFSTGHPSSLCPPPTALAACAGGRRFFVQLYRQRHPLQVAACRPRCTPTIRRAINPTWTRAETQTEALHMHIHRSTPRHSKGTAVRPG
jgi:hypothetical protein